VTAELLKRLLSGATDSVEVLRSRTVTHGQRGDLARTLDNLTLARSEYEAALTIALRLVKRAPNDAYHRATCS
jgi:hypothetical protein